MRLHSTPPTIPPDMLSEFGEPEQAFGPSRQPHIGAAIGGVCVVLGVLLVTARVIKLPVIEMFNPWAAGAMALGGLVILYGAWKLPLSWVFVCPRGLVRKYGSRWEGRDWSKAVRFEEGILGRGFKIRQCRLVWNFGLEWGFIAHHVADYDRLCEVLRQKVSKRSAGATP